LSLWPQRPYDIPVHTNNGQVIGHQAPNASHVTEYLGIPYGQPPVGSLRFAEPQKYTAKVHFVASHFVSSYNALVHPPPKSGLSYYLVRVRSDLAP